MSLAVMDWPHWVRSAARLTQRVPWLRVPLSQEVCLFDCNCQLTLDGSHSEVKRNLREGISKFSVGRSGNGTSALLILTTSRSVSQRLRIRTVTRLRLPAAMR
jgi:hypothetical protein